MGLSKALGLPRNELANAIRLEAMDMTLYRAQILTISREAASSIGPTAFTTMKFREMRHSFSATINRLNNSTA